MFSAYVEGKGFPIRVSVISLICAAVLFFTNLLLIPIWGAIGSAIASSITYGTAMLLLAIVYCRMRGERLSAPLIPGLQDIKEMISIGNNTYKILSARFNRL